MRQKEEYEHAIRTIENMSSKMEQNVKVEQSKQYFKGFFLFLKYLHHNNNIMLNL